MHVDRNGWADIGYSFGACPHGWIFTGRGFGRVQAAQLSEDGKRQNGNTRYYSVTLMGGPQDAVTAKQLDAVRFLRLYASLRWGARSDVYKHSDFTSTSCPGPEVRRIVGSAEKTPDAGMRPTLRLRSPRHEGVEVELLQMLLKLRVPPLVSDGEYGPKTAEAVRRYKAEVGLPRDTVAGVGVWSKLLRG